jgi:hypothetical protein
VGVVLRNHQDRGIAGRPQKSKEIEDLVVRMATENRIRPLKSPEKRR